MRRAYFFCFLLLCGAAAHAQKTKVYMSGLKAGFNSYTLKVDGQPDNVSDDQRSNFHAGLFYTIHFGKLFSLQPEALYSGEGAKFKSANSKSERALSYVNIPVMCQLNFKGVYVEAGPGLGVLVKGKETSTVSGVTSELDLKKQYKQTNIFVAAGFGFRPKNLGIYARYNYGLSNMSISKTAAETNSRGFQAGLSWSFLQQ